MSPRKRTPKDKSIETLTDAELAPAAPAESTGTASAEPPAAETAADEGFAEKVGQKKWVNPPDPFGIAADYLAGIRLFESRQDRQMAIKFGEGRPEDKPSAEVIAKLKEAGYRWNPADRIWAHPVVGESAMTTRIEAEWLYQELRQMIRKEKGIEAGQEIPV